MDRKFYPNAIHAIMLLVLFFSAQIASAQTLSQPVLGFSNPCPSEGFNSFTVDFAWQIPLVNEDNKFILELSDANGSFDNATTLSTVTDKNTVLTFSFKFAFPEATYGEKYRIRVRSTSPAKTSSASGSFPAYYRTVNESLVLNNFQDATLCSDPILLEVNNYPGEAYYNWYKDFNLIPGEKNAYLEVTEPGLYFVEVDYGFYCSSETSSNLVSVTQNDQLSVTISGDANVELCPNGSYTLTASTDITPDENFTYHWYRGETLLSSTASNSYTVTDRNGDAAGEYFVEVDPGSGCPALSSSVVLSINDFEVTTNLATDIVLMPSQSKTIQATTTASNPVYQWYKDDVAIADATTATLSINGPGSYYVEVKESAGCGIAKKSTPITVSYPSDFEIKIAVGDYTACTSSQAALSLSELKALTNDGTVIAVDESIVEQFSFQWYLNGTAVSGATTRQITVNNTAANGNYTLKGTLESFNSTSNAIAIKIGIGTPAITADLMKICEDVDQVTISSSITATSYTYSWYRDNILLDETSATLKTLKSGTYQLKVKNNDCEVASNTVTIEPYTDDQITLNKEGVIYLQKGQAQEVIASGADTYVWYDNAQQVVGTTASLLISTEGVYTLVASIGGCEFVKVIEAVLQESTIIPNVISPNGDGINDTWAIPVTYLNNPEIQINIYTSSGELVFSGANYQNNWPESTINYSGRNPVYYYRIIKNGATIKKGTITIIK
ncbi:gliding motility-associated C-terminal domain-containing protein [Zhouia amylolytica]|uniref:Gliding motility-associated C-terminal domain-containing protein n=1 Tax=Zhouia amylolytica TaxID=376730 RepID=A0A1I6PRL5_9FLAO|nr:gliding motility-associated C-terminal domain-containing protein [Zhouia amylolytica]SFS42675.1 gliding motility-associated C-terminal domain-containing protein [Zhouia amylolytica]